MGMFAEIVEERIEEDLLKNKNQILKEFDEGKLNHLKINRDDLEALLNRVIDTPYNG